MAGLGHELVGLHDSEVGQAAEVGLEAPDALVARVHRVVMRGWVLVVDMVAMHGDPVAGLPVANGRTNAQHHARGVGANDVIIECVATAELALFAEAIEKAERWQRLEDAGPHGVEVDRAGHHGNDGFVGADLGPGHVANMQALAGILIGRGNAFEHAHVFAAHICGPIRVGQWDAAELGSGCTGLDGFKDLFHPLTLPIDSERPLTVHLRFCRPLLLAYRSVASLAYARIH